MNTENKRDAIDSITEVLPVATDKQLNEIRRILTVGVPGEETPMEEITRKDHMCVLLEENNRILSGISQMLIDIKVNFCKNIEPLSMEFTKLKPKKQEVPKPEKKADVVQEVKNEKKSDEAKTRFYVVPPDDKKMSKQENKEDQKRIVRRLILKDTCDEFLDAYIVCYIEFDSEKDYKLTSKEARVNFRKVCKSYGNGFGNADAAKIISAIMKIAAQYGCTKDREGGGFIFIKGARIKQQQTEIEM